MVINILEIALLIEGDWIYFMKFNMMGYYIGYGGMD